MPLYIGATAMKENSYKACFLKINDVFNVFKVEYLKEYIPVLKKE